MSKVAIVGSHGVGDSLLSLQCASFVPNSDVVLAVRDEVYKPVWWLAGNKFNISQHPEKEKWGEDNWILKHPEVLEKYREDHGYDEIYYVIPDLLFNNPYAFDWKKYHAHPQIITKARLFLNQRKWTNTETVFCNLSSTTAGYMYKDTYGLLRTLGESMPEYTFFVPMVKKWADKSIDYGEPKKLPENVIIDKNPDILAAIDMLKICDYCICLDSGFSHVAYHLGISRLLLDPWFSNNGVAFWARWRPDLDESIDLGVPIETIVSIVKTNLEIPQTCLLPRTIASQPIDWKQALIFKH